ncbi:MAG: hypothetical protein NE330_17255 [Lentisphaeraceae bacterium]|nr:hypothetical protein [Lentisphaeraceae bacterium]
MKTLIIGNGFCGSRLKSVIPNSAVAELPKHASDDCIPFDLIDEKDWTVFSKYQNIIITCKLENKDLALKLSAALKNKFVLILSTAKAFVVSTSNEVINETFPLEINSRNTAENYFLEFSSILHLGLIWGEERQPKKWLKQKRIKNGNKLVNLIHVDDICSIIKYLTAEQIYTGRLLVSDGKPLTWEVIANHNNIQLPSTRTGVESKKFDTQKLKNLLPKDYQFRKLLN